MVIYGTVNIITYIKVLYIKNEKSKMNYNNKQIKDNKRLQQKDDI